ncbi:class I SAM-dependent methyltransferase [Lichenifustis flavocetrariae]|uniref:Methyltransferase domain-containing protein n=1 Tax=Lichenifustis flavocetrariae TaxID=2949735 RepID=A0AA42CMC8_9HYPH|nr:methyltransferase domain-containing protein [Lichenifustis flavocetrariae]MCW6511431.1 methyltransferase domain-containing protein [Lichenifustis flavocetrariae]
MPVVLHVGCGPKDIRRMPAYFQDGTWREIRLDIDAAVRPDVLGSMTDMGAVESGSVEAVFSSHNIEHLFPHEVPVALAEFQRVLGPTGFALITCPDLQTVASHVANGRLLDPLYQSGLGPITPLDILYGHRESIARGNHFMAHRGGFTMRTLGAALQETGFGRVVIHRRQPHFDLWAVAMRTDPGEEAGNALAGRLFPT